MEKFKQSLEVRFHLFERRKQEKLDLSLEVSFNGL